MVPTQRLALPLGVWLVSCTATVSAFVMPSPFLSSVPSTSTTSTHLVDAAVTDWAATTLPTIMDSTASSSSSTLLSFTDQGANLAGIFFQASLLPYLLFLYFLSFRANRIPALGNFGFQFVLLFVLSTIPSGIVSKSVYGTSLANVDWLHGGAETLLTVANVLIVRCVLCILVVMDGLDVVATMSLIVDLLHLTHVCYYL